MRIELTQVALYAPQTYASTSSAIAAATLINIHLHLSLNKRNFYTIGRITKNARDAIPRYARRDKTSTIVVRSG